MSSAPIWVGAHLGRHNIPLRVRLGQTVLEYDLTPVPQSPLKPRQLLGQRLAGSSGVVGLNAWIKETFGPDANRVGGWISDRRRGGRSLPGVIRDGSRLTLDLAVLAAYLEELDG